MGYDEVMLDAGGVRGRGGEPESSDCCSYKMSKKRLCNCGVRDQSGTVTNQRMPAMAGHHQSLGEVRKNSFLETLEGTWPCWCLYFIFLTLRTVRK